jgi:hypothetical protein
MYLADFLSQSGLVDDIPWMHWFLVTAYASADGQGPDVRWLHVAQPLDRWLEEQRQAEVQQQQPKRSKQSHGCVLDLSG